MASLTGVSLSQAYLSQPISIKLNPTFDEAQKIYWNLGCRYWMQIIDGKYHIYESNVFDEGLHFGDKEPGFLESLKAGCVLASAHLTERPSVDFYKTLHKTLCAHFRGEENKTEMTAAETGKFRNIGVHCNLFIQFDVMSPSERENMLLVQIYKGCYFLNPQKKTDEKVKSLLVDFFEEFAFCCPRLQTTWITEKKEYWINQKDLDEKIRSEYPSAHYKYQEALDRVSTLKSQLNEYVESVCRELDEAPFVHFQQKGDRNIDISYQINHEFFHERIVLKLFERYNRKIDQSKNVSEKKLEAICELFQLLEWVHPFHDGQGRTDLVLLSKLLVDEGFTPAILEAPYMSSFALPDDWVKALKLGMQTWNAH